MRQTLFLTGLLFFILPQCHSQQPESGKVDSLKTILQIHKDDTVKINALIQLYTLTHESNPETVISLIKDAEQLSKKLNYAKGIAASLYYTGFYTVTIKADYKTGFQYFIDAFNFAEQHDQKFYMAKALAGMAYVLSVQGQQEKAIENYDKAIHIFKEINEQREIALLYVNVSDAYVGLGRNEQADSVVKRGLWMAEQIKDDYVTGRLSTARSGQLSAQHKYPEAIAYGEKAISIFYKNKDFRDFAYCLTLVAQQNSDSGNLPYALTLADSALSVCKEHGLPIEEMTVYAVLESIHFKRKDFEMAYFFKSMLANMKDSSFSQSKSAEIANIESKYLQDKKDVVETARLQRQKLIRNGFVIAFIIMLLFAIVFFAQRNKISKGKKRSDELLLNILPAEVAEELKAKGSADAKQFDQVTVMFTDFKGFTQISEKLSPTELVKEIHDCFKAFDHIITRHNIEKIKTIGDSYMRAGGLPVANKTHATDVVNAALEIQHFMEEHLQQRKKENKEVFEIRIGINTGAVVAGIVGVKKFAYDIWGDAVNIASRMESSGEAGKVNISGSTYQLVKDKFNCTHRGKIEAKNKGVIDMYYVESKLQEV